MKSNLLVLLLALSCWSAGGQTIPEKPLRFEETTQSSREDYLSMNQRDEVLTHFYRGRKFDYEEEYELSIAEYTKCINRDSLFVHGYFARGTAKINDSQYWEAIKDFNKVLELSPDFGTAYFYRAFARMKKYRFSKFSDTTTVEHFETQTYLTPPNRVYEGRSLTIAEKELVCNDFEKGLHFSSEKTAVVEVLRTFCETEQD